MPAARTVLVTGVSGHIAGAMADRLAAGGLQVRAMVRAPDQVRLDAGRGPFEETVARLADLAQLQPAWAEFCPSASAPHRPREEPG